MSDKNTVTVYGGGWLASRDHALLLAGKCPNCGAVNSLIAGPRGGLARNTLCSGCQMEFNLSPAFAQVISKQCDAERMRETYGFVPLPEAKQ